MQFWGNSLISIVNGKRAGYNVNLQGFEVNSSLNIRRSADSPDSADGDSCQATLKTADNMPYEAKASGRNRVAWMDEDGKQLFEK